MRIRIKFPAFLRTALICLSLTIFIACSETPKSEIEKATQNSPPPAPVTGRFAFQRMIIQAKGWAVDAQPLKLSGLFLKQVPVEPGKCGAWQATFVSAQKSKARTYTLSVVEIGGIHEGVLAGREETWSVSRLNS